MNTILDDQNAPDEHIVSLPVSQLYTNMPLLSFIAWATAAASGFMSALFVWAILKLWKEWNYFMALNSEDTNLHSRYQEMQYFYWRSLKQYAIIALMMLVGAILLGLCTRALFQYKSQFKRLDETRLATDLELAFAAKTQLHRYLSLFAIAMVGFVVLAIVLDF